MHTKRFDLPVWSLNPCVFVSIRDFFQIVSLARCAQNIKQSLDVCVGCRIHFRHRYRLSAKASPRIGTARLLNPPDSVLPVCAVGEEW